MTTDPISDLSPRDTGAEQKATPLERYFRILEVLSAIPSGVSLTDLTTMLQLSKGTVHRLLATMTSHGLVDQAEKGGGQYRLGQRVRRLAVWSIDPDVIANLSNPLLVDLSEMVGETCYLCQLQGNVVRSIAIATPDVTWQNFVLPGKVLQPHATAGGKAVAAFQPPRVIEEMLSLGRPSLTSFTKTDRAELLSEYAQIRKSHIATCLQEVEMGLGAFAIPIESPIGVQYSLGILGPITRIEPLLNGHGRRIAAKTADAVRALLTRIAEPQD